MDVDVGEGNWSWDFENSFGPLIKQSTKQQTTNQPARDVFLSRHGTKLRTEEFSGTFFNVIIRPRTHTQEGHSATAERQRRWCSRLGTSGGGWGRPDYSSFAVVVVSPNFRGFLLFSHQQPLEKGCCSLPTPRAGTVSAPHHHQGRSPPCRRLVKQKKKHTHDPLSAFVLSAGADDVEGDWLGYWRKKRKSSRFLLSLYFLGRSLSRSKLGELRE